MATTDSQKYRQISSSLGSGKGRPRTVWGSNNEEEVKFDTASTKHRNATTQSIATSLPTVNSANFHRIKTPKIFQKRSDSFLSDPEPQINSRKNSKGADALRRSDIIPKTISTGEERIRTAIDPTAFKNIPTPKTPPRTSPKFLTPLEETTNIANGSENGGSGVQLPLEWYDVFLETPEIWTTKSFQEFAKQYGGLPLKAFSKFIHRGSIFKQSSTDLVSAENEEVVVKWEPCHVLSFVEDKQKFLIQWVATGKQKLVTRLNLRFEAEDASTFQKRVDTASQFHEQNQQLAEQQQKIKQLNVDVYEISDVEVHSMLQLVVPEIPRSKAELIYSLSSEIKSQYTFQMKKCHYEYQMFGLEGAPDRMELSNNLEAFKDIPKGTVKQGIETMKNIAFCGNPDMQEALVTISGFLHSLDSISFVDVDSPEFEESLVSLKKFGEHQKAVISSGLLKITSVIQSICTHISKNLDTVFSFSETDLEVFESSRLMRLLRTVNFMIRTQMTEVITHSLAIWAYFFHDFTVESFDEAESTRGMTARSLQTPLFKVNIQRNETEFEFTPSVKETSNLIMELITEVLNGIKIPTVETRVMLNLRFAEKNIPTITSEDEIIQQTFTLLRTILNILFLKIIQNENLLLSFVNGYQKFVDDILSSQETEDMSKASLVNKSNSVEKYFRITKSIMDRSLDEVPLSIFIVKCRHYKEQLSTTPTNLASSILQELLDSCRQKGKHMKEIFKYISENASLRSESPEQFERFVTDFQTWQKQMKEVEEDFKRVKEQWELLERFSFGVTEEDMSDYWSLFSIPQELSVLVCNREVSLGHERNNFIKQLEDQKIQFQQELLNIESDIDALKAFFDVEKSEEYMVSVTAVEKKLESFRELANLINAREKIFDLRRTTKFAKDIAQLSKNFEPYSQMWNMIHSFQRNVTNWMHGAFAEIDGEKVEADVLNWHNLIGKLTKTMKGSTAPTAALTEFKTRIEGFKQHLPIVSNLRFTGMRDRHWGTLSQKLGMTVRLTTDLTLDTLIKAGFTAKLDILTDIKNIAVKEYSLEKQLEIILNEWDHLELEFAIYRSTQVLKGTDKLSDILEDQTIKLQAMKGSAFAKPFETRILGFEEKLTYISKLLDEWVQMQTSWMYLEPIFSSPDIMMQLPAEGRRFASVDAIWRTLMKETVLKPSIKTLATNRTLLETVSEANKRLEQVHKSLVNYLDMKRTAFPRFFFLSNEELVEIFSQTKEPSAVQPHLRKLFESISQLEFLPSGAINAMFSVEKERIQFYETVPTTGPIEQWLGGVEKAMRMAMRKIIQKSIAEFSPETREQWLVSYPSQVIGAVSQVIFTRSVIKSFQDMQYNTQSLRAYKALFAEQINQVVKLLREDIPLLVRLALEALIVVDVHNRDVLTQLVLSEVTKEDDFEWITKMRYVYENETVNVKMTNATVEYAYEYLGSAPRLVVTPLTERCYVTLMNALQMSLGGAPEGPAGTGKTETTKDLAKAIAKQCVVFNCSDGLNYVAMGRFFRGLATSGAWACFDEFNRIEIEVLSVVAQQILTIQQAILNRVKVFNFEGIQVSLEPTCCVFITMNPGYAGRAELPKNLKALFRPISMMVPDFALIAEISLLSYGFQDARPLAQKVVSTFRLASEQLSAQHHYDFGMRTVKAVLLTASAFKRAMPQENEENLLHRALGDCNVPKLLAEDIPLFKGIMADLFPDIEIKERDYKDLLETIREVCKQMKLQGIPEFEEKCLQVYETQRVRHGVMLVGDSYSAKSSCIKVVASALTSLCQKFPNDPRYSNIVQYLMNPKSVTMDQLYGKFDPISHEWADGVLSHIMRKCTGANLDPKERQWIVFDGPVDALWIENMNTVLDDNKKLCLSSGEIIILSPSNTMVFEVGDLKEASPATVSRCGMIYMEPNQLGWKPIIISRQAGIPAHAKQHEDLIVSLFDLFIPTFLNFCKNQCRDVVIGLVNATQVRSLFDIMESLIAGCNANNVFTQLSATNQINWIESFFVFALVWSIGANVDAASRKKFDKFIKDSTGSSEESDRKNPVIKEIAIPFPEKGMVFDYYFDKEKNSWVNWMSGVTTVQTNNDDPLDFHEIIVPNVESVRTSFLLNLLIENGKHIMIVGPTGTGKTATIKDLLLNKLDKQKYFPMFVTLSHQSSANSVQEIIETKLVKLSHESGVFGPPDKKKGVLFVDDLNMPAKEKYGAQPPLELLRQTLDHGGWYDLKTNAFKEIANTQMICSMQAEGREPITSRLTAKFSVITVQSFDDTNLSGIFSDIVSTFLSQRGVRSGVIYTNATAIVNASVELYRNVCNELLPTPSKFYYTFNLRDLSKIFQGILSIPLDSINKRDQLVRLWAHECYRVFGDRLVTKDDQDFFAVTLNVVAQKHFEETYEHALQLSLTKNNPLVPYSVFADFLNSSAATRQYAEVNEPVALRNVLNEYLDDYIMYSNAAKTKLVLFDDAMLHVSRICRILRQPAGHALLVGVPGSGRESLTRLASFICDYQIFKIEMKKSFGIADWKDQLKKLARRVGVEAKQTIFLLKDSEIVSDTFLEDVNNLLNNGEVPNLFVNEEFKQLIEDVGAEARNSNSLKDNTRDSIYNFFVDRCKTHLHVVFCANPAGDAFRNRVRKFPALVNCCTVDLFFDWPSDALKAVAQNKLEDLGLNPIEKDKVVDICVHMNNISKEMAARYLQEMRRHYYISPTSYLTFIGTFARLLVEKRVQLSSKKERYAIGIKKLLETAESVAQMRTTLEALQPQLITASLETEHMLAEVQRQKTEADLARDIIKGEEVVAEKSAQEAQRMSKICEEDLNQVLPTLKEAEGSLKILNKGDIYEIKSMANPPPGVKLVMEAVCILKGIKPIQEQGPTPGTKVMSYWGNAKKMISDTYFLQSLLDFDKENIASNIIDKLKVYIDDPEFVPVKIQRVSLAATSLCTWVRAIEKYYHVLQLVRPKRAALEEAERNLKDIMDKLAAKKAELTKIEDHIAELMAQFAEANAKKEDLESQVKKCEVQLERAQNLIGGLSGEKTRWQEAASELDRSSATILGDVLLSSGVVAYLGAFTGAYRSECLKRWLSVFQENILHRSNEFSLQKIFAEPVVIRNWLIAGLPPDRISIESAVIVKKSTRWPLIIDPQGQASNWIKKMEASRNIKATSFSDPELYRTLENAIRYGAPVLLEDVNEGEGLKAIDSVLQQDIIKQSGRNVIRLGDSMVEYSDDFTLYITTKHHNPHFSADIATKVTLVNFTLTMEGLEDQLLGIVVARERPDLEEIRNKLVVETAYNKQRLQETEDEILKAMASAQGNFLEDDELVAKLNDAKNTSGEIREHLIKAEKTELEINTTRMNYTKTAHRAAQLFFCVADLTTIDHMYQFSLEFFVDIFHKSITEAPQTNVLSQRLENLNSTFTYNLYCNICTSLFEKHKLLFSLVMCSKVLLEEKQLEPAEWRFFLVGKVEGLIKVTSQNPNPAPNWLSDKSWGEILSLATIKTFADLPVKFVEEISGWQAFFLSRDPHLEKFPGNWNEKLTSFQKILLLRCIRADKLTHAIRNFIASSFLGPKFVDPPVFDLLAIYKNSVATTPLIFLLSEDVSDPRGLVVELAQKVKIPEKMVVPLSLGQGQGPAAQAAIEQAVDTGKWVILQNCHLALSFLPTLESLIANINPKRAHPDFRLWLTSMPTDQFPVKILLLGMKLTNEPPKGIKPNMFRTFSGFDPVPIASLPPQGKKLLFSLVLFHALIQERRKFGTLGWNIPYAFSESDLFISTQQLFSLVSQKDAPIPFSTLKFLTAEINYGGRITDKWDKRTLNYMLDDYYTERVLNNRYKHFKNVETPFPQDGQLEDIIEFVKLLPSQDPPSIFGLHDNAEISSGMKETNEMLDYLISLQPRTGNSLGGGRDKATKDAAKDMLANLPAYLDLQHSLKRNPQSYHEPLNTVLKHEIVAYNRLLATIQKSLKDLIMAIDGLLVMSEELEMTAARIYDNLVPMKWSNSSYPSMKPLSFWMIDLANRIRFINKWVNEGMPNVFWLSGFFQPQAFLTAVLQKYCRQQKLSIDVVSYHYKVLETTDESLIQESPATGVYVRGLFIEGASWDFQDQLLVESEPCKIYTQMPLVWMIPVAKPRLTKSPSGNVIYYSCPVYHTPARAGNKVVSTTGNSINYVTTMELPSTEEERYWAKRGVAMYLSTPE